IAAGSVPALAAHAAQQGKDLFVLWLDAHPDLHLLDTTASGNLHGTPAAYILGREGFDGHYPPLPAGVKPSNFCALGLRSVDPAERAFIAAAGIDAQDVNAHDITAPLTRFLDRVRAAGGHLHVSFDVDFVDPTIAPAVGTPVPGGATFREAQRIMALVHDSGLLTSMDLAELNPLLDARGQTARLMVDLCACAFGRPVLDRPKAA
ncbi:MAG: arginase family protein, partial [Pseudomonadota bacterium]